MKLFEDVEHLGSPTLCWLAGVDEVGRGPLAGPVVACGALLELTCEPNAELLLWAVKDFCKIAMKLGIGDSKKIPPAKRKDLLKSFGASDWVEENSPVKMVVLESINYQVSVCRSVISPERIDEINILNASLEGMRMSVQALAPVNRGGIALVDGNRVWKEALPLVETRALVKGDARSALIGTASLFAKEYRDQLMIRLDERYPGYGFGRHFGYPTPAHREAIQGRGITPIHRKTFAGVKEYVRVSPV